jgi:AGCS family alanine or glycine:cation symporter
MDGSGGFIRGLEAFFTGSVVAALEAVIFFDVWFWDGGPGQPDVQLPLVVLWLIIGSTYFTLRFRFINLRGFRHALDCVRGRYTQPNEAGEISHFQALSAALAATIGLGNIAGVAFAVGIGGPGAVFWMTIAGFLGMSSKFAECTLGLKYRVQRSDGHVSGGGMHYLRDGLASLGMPRLGVVLSVVFAVMCIGGSLGGGNMYQANQTYAQAATVFPSLASGAGAVLFGLTLALLVGVVIIGGIRRIGEVASALVPFMCLLYILCGLLIVATHAAVVPAAFATIVREAFSFEAGLGGFVGVLIQGFRRACFSNEAGAGSAAIAHSAARTGEPLREGMVSLLEPFVDTLIVCNVTGAYANPEAGTGIAMTSWAFATVFPWFPTMLSFIAFLFAYCTMISWSYYGEQCWAYLFGVRSILFYKTIFLVFTWLGAIFEATAVVDFGDMMILGMAFPNLIGVMLLSGQIKADLDVYWRKLRAGEFPRYF